MLEIKREENKQEAKAFLESLDITCDIENDNVMCAREKGEILAVGALTLKNYKVFLDLAVSRGETNDNLPLVLGLMKSLLNFADLRGIKTVFGSNEALFPLYRMLRFQKEEGIEPEIYSLSLEGYFTCDSCGHP